MTTVEAVEGAKERVAELNRKGLMATTWDDLSGHAKCVWVDAILVADESREG